MFEHIRWPLRLHRVEGHSMQPRWQPGDYVLSLYWPGPYRAGQTVVAEHPRFGRIIKQIARTEQTEAGDTLIWLTGTHSSSTRTERLGALPRSAMIGRVIKTVRAPAKQGA